MNTLFVLNDPLCGSERPHNADGSTRSSMAQLADGTGTVDRVFVF
jgi:hypothetical protein